ncbi:hypothetical protein DMH04_26925 [Kibdelosporangium aridum]|uniref:Lipoprotein LpqN n=1 Tax=Kibdelosporangium aridum TaxID=2030 RepID=A0A428Z5C5_KIBAR|nr:hypothetical protein [Kibdelosporangium aridum]RSM81978.1 hypothetical protein DMH04_26925 [Kibdelosporangium aridum]
MTIESTVPAAKTVRYPGEELPAPPPFAIDIPEDFVATAAPRLLALVQPKVKADKFQPSLTVTADLIPASIEPAAVLNPMLDEAVKRPEGELVTPATEQGSHQAAGSVRFAVSDVSGPVSLGQSLSIHLAPDALSNGMRYAFSVSATWDANNSHDVGATLRAIQDSFRFNA